MSYVIPIFEPSQEIFRQKLSALLETVGFTALGISAFRLTPITTTERNAMANVKGLVVYDGTLNKLCQNTGSGWQVVTSV